MLSVEELRERHQRNEIDTVLVAFPDLFGRLVGKRVLAGFFLSELESNGGRIEACNYLLAVDVDMNPVEGYRFANWDEGYGDVVCTPVLSTLRQLPWLDRTALVICDVTNPDGTPVSVAPRTILSQQLERMDASGQVVKAGTELEFYLYKESLEHAWETGFERLTPSSPYVIDYHLLATSADEPVIQQLRNQMAEAGLPVENSKGEAGRGQYELNLRYAEAMAMADNHTIYKHGAKEIASGQQRALTFMAKPDASESGSSCHIHSSVWDRESDRSLMADGDGMSETFRHWLGGLLHTAADFSLCWAPYVNSYKRYQPDSWAPTAIGWGMDNRTLGFRVVGHGQGMRVESRIPGADCNPYLALAATIAGGRYGLANNVEPGDPYVGNGYESDLPRIPATLPEAIELFENSDVVAATFGADVQFHLAHQARQHWRAFNKQVTTWELEQGFDRL